MDDFKDVVGIDSLEFGVRYSDILLSCRNSDFGLLVICDDRVEDWVLNFVKSRLSDGQPILLVANKDQAPNNTRWLEHEIY
jgi:hypothetical protein